MGTLKGLHVDDTGESDLAPVVCLHSLFLDNRMFDGFVRAADGRFRVIRPEFRGQGRSPASSEMVTMDRCVQDIESVIDDLGINSAHVVAQSMGGDVALRLAARRPGSISSMVLLGSSACAEPPENLAAFRPIADSVEKDGFVGDTLETTMQIMFGETSRADPTLASTVALWRERIAALSPQLSHAIRGVVERSSVADTLGQIECPVLVVSGGEDIARPPGWSDQLVAGIPDSLLWRLPKVGHSVILEAPDAVHQRIVEFLNAAID